MSPAERIQTLARTPSDPWSLEQLVCSTHDALSRWRIARKQLGMAFGFPPVGVIGAVAPDFVLSPDMASLIPSDASTKRIITLGFLWWAHCPATRDIPNPFDPMLDFVHHGGTFSTENGYIDIHALNGERGSIYMLQYLTQHA